MNNVDAAEAIAELRGGQRAMLKEGTAGGRKKAESALTEKTGNKNAGAGACSTPSRTVGNEGCSRGAIDVIGSLLR